ncbi:MAG: transcriptional repressor [Selenomonadaceae bacterium]|nr:transcriptional repressor [Selenomonadaceae bacterium]
MRKKSGKSTNKTFTIADLKSRLQAKDYKMTEQRREILQIFLDQPAEHHLSAEDVHAILRSKKSEIGLATVYRSLELLGSLGLLLKIEFGDGCSRYELNTTDPNSHRHHHLICIKCHKVIEFDEDKLDELEAEIANKSGFEILNHEVKFFGYCKDCRNQSDDE